MPMTELHAALLSQAFQKILGDPSEGSVAFVKCLVGDVARELAASDNFAPDRWEVRCVADYSNPSTRTVTADQAVELRESKGAPLLFLVDTSSAGAGMDGIYSAAREISESALFDEANPMAAREITRRISKASRVFAERAVKKGRARGRRINISPWTEFDFYARTAATGTHPGSLVYLLGLWPIHPDESDGLRSLEIAAFFVTRLLVNTPSTATASSMIESLKLVNPTSEQEKELEFFLRSVATKPVMQALAEGKDTAVVRIAGRR
jgi:DNA phosphorothioation-dependent restriction protein DptH